MAKAMELRTEKERTLFLISAVVSGLAWLALVLTVIGIAYAISIGIFILMATALFLAHVRGNGVKIGPEQLPELWQRCQAAAAKLGLERTPDVYIVQAGGALNAFATKLLSRNFVVIFSDLVDACGDDTQALDMVIGHEMGHLAAGHLKWNGFLLPARIVPWLGPAYSRACEYTCDRCGLATVGDAAGAVRGLVVLAAGGKAARAVNVQAFVKQREESGGFWMAVHELVSSHPYLCKRVAAVIERARPGTYPEVGRNPLAYLFAPFFGFASGGAAGGAVAVVMILGVLAALAAPAFVGYVKRSKETAALQQQQQMMMMMAAPDGDQGAEGAGDMRDPNRLDALRQLPSGEAEIEAEPEAEAEAEAEAEE